jgi:PAS domain S-box-containing protein
MGSTEGAGPQLVVQTGTGMLETFLSLMPDAAVAADCHGTIVAVHARTQSFFGYSAEELEGTDRGTRP